MGSDFLNLLTPVQVDDIERIAHAEGVHRFAWCDPQALIVTKCRLAQQAASSLERGFCFYHPQGFRQQVQVVTEKLGMSLFQSYD